MSRAKSAETLSDAAAVSNRRKESRAEYKRALRYALYVITHPFDGFWDLTREHKGNLAAATTFLALFLITRVLKILCTSFQFFDAAVQHINVFEEMGSLLLPFLILCLANWAMTTLFEGKGRFKDIYIGMCYALVPYILIQLPMILVSNILTYEEGSLYSVMLSISVIWSVFLVFGKTFIFIIVTIVGACVIIFLALVCLSLLSDAIGFFVSLYREAAYRLN